MHDATLTKGTSEVREREHKNENVKHPLQIMGPLLKMFKDNIYVYVNFQKCIVLV
jgi:hypothetical protein